MFLIRQGSENCSKTKGLCWFLRGIKGTVEIGFCDWAVAKFVLSEEKTYCVNDSGLAGGVFSDNYIQTLSQENGKRVSKTLVALNV
jgi:hypothetical protein